jgi:hypothetical protein
MGLAMTWRFIPCRRWATQIRRGLGCIKSLYGSPCGAWSHEQASGWCQPFPSWLLTGQERFFLMAGHAKKPLPVMRRGFFPVGALIISS